MEDPAVLDLVMCLLDADSELFGDLGSRTYDALDYTYGNALP